MIQISKQEKEIVLAGAPDTYIVRTVPQKSKRHKYYMAEYPKAMEIIRAVRGE